MLAGLFAMLALTGGFAPHDSSRSLSRVVTPRIPAAAAAMVESAGRAVNLHRPEMMSSFASGAIGDAFSWTSVKRHDWKADVLPVPGDPARQPLLLAVFHTFHTCESDGDHVYPLVLVPSQAGIEWKLGTEIPETETLGLRVRDHSIDAAIDVDRQTATFRDSVSFDRTEAGQGGREPAPYALLRISDDFRVSSLSSDAGVVPHEQAGGIVAFVPPATQQFALSCAYSGKLNHKNGDFIHDDEAVIASYWYPHIARLPATLSLTATAPAGWTAVAQGEQIASKVNPDGSQTVSWRNDLPTSYFTLDMGRYRVTSRQWKGRLLSAYLLEENPDTSARTARASLDTLQDSLAFFEKTFGAFPYRRYAIVQTRGPFNGALEAYSFATFGPQTLPEFIPHEVSHTWWGGIVPCTYTRSMWNEAFANYSDDLFRRFGAPNGEKSGQYAATVEQRLKGRSATLRRYSGLAVSRVYDTDDERHNSIGYGKGSQVLRVLEAQIGQAALISAMRAFIEGHVRGEPAEWPEFEAAVEKVTGKDERWFFAQWMDRPGAPRVALTNVALRSNGSEAWVLGRIRQAAPLYRMSLPVAVELRSGAVVRETVETSEADTEFRIRVPGRPDRVRVDPEAIFPLETAMPAQGSDDPLTYLFP